MRMNKIWRLVLLLLLGQLVSLFLAVACFTSSYIADLVLCISTSWIFSIEGADTPLTQSLFTYLSLAVIYGSTFLCRQQKLLVPLYWYIILAFVDVQGNYLVVKAYQYSSITSVTLLDCWTIPWVIIFTWFVLRTRYSLWQFLDASICVVGLVLVLLSDGGISGGGGRNPLLGDTLVIAGTFCYALSNVGEEYCVKKKDQVEVVAMLGVFGVLVSVREISLFERKDLASVKWSPTMMSGAMLFNLSLLTSDMWAVLIRIFFYKQQVDWLYYLAFAAVAVGLIIYSLKVTTSSTPMTIGDEEATIQYEPLPEDSSAHRAEGSTG